MSNNPLQTASNAWGAARILNASGNPMQPTFPPQPPANPPSSGPPGGGHEVNIAKLEQSVGWLWKLAIGTVVIGCGMILSSFLVLDGKMAKLGEDVTTIKVEGARQGAHIEEILKKLDGNDKPQASPRSR